MNKKRILFVILCIVILFVGIIGFTIRYIHYRNATISDSSGCITKYRISATIIGPVYWGNVGHSSKITIIDDHEEVYIVDLYDDNCTIVSEDGFYAINVPLTSLSFNVDEVENARGIPNDFKLIVDHLNGCQTVVTTGGNSTFIEGG